jgi:uncharacterized membrane protein
MMRRPLRLLRGGSGHPSHPPLTSATVGAFVTPSVLGLASVAALAPERTAVGWWLALIVGLVLTVPTMATGMLDEQEFMSAFECDEPSRDRFECFHRVLLCVAGTRVVAARARPSKITSTTEPIR